MKHSFSTVILAAGNSSRIGIPKLSLRDKSNNSFIEKIVYQYFDFGCEKIAIVLNKSGYEFITNYKINFPKNTKLIHNNEPELGRFRSIKLGLQAIRSQYCFIHNIDNPNAKSEILTKLSENIKEFDWVKPTHYGKGGHPVLISKRIISNIISSTKNDIVLRDFLADYKVKKLEINDSSILQNINTASDYQQYFKSNNQKLNK